MAPTDEDGALPDPPGYPAEFDTDVVLSDGATAHVRPIRPDDGDRLLAFHARQSPQSIYYRYFSPRPRLSERDVERMTGLDYVDRMALIALRGDELIGVARYDRLRHLSEAEVAFFVDDANHGRGLATVLLEHLAVRAREVGITGFTASVLPDNRRMIGVFSQAGFETATKFADGVVEVRLGITPTLEAEAAIDARAHLAASRAVQRLLSPRSIAVIGASRSRGSIGHDVLRNLQRAGFEGPVWPVNPHAEHVRSVRAVPSILDIHEDVDLAIIAVPAAQVAAVVEECARKQVYGVVILSAGFAEVGDAGAALEAEVLRTARSWGIRVVGPNCLGIINTDPVVRLHATFVEVVPLRGRVSLLSESGMVGAAIIGQARELGVGFSSFVALGNRADVSGNDLLDYWADDEHTDVVCMYIESFGNARHFTRLARRLSRSKPVVAVKAGWVATPGLDGMSPSSYDDALLRQTGVVRVPTLAALLDTTRLLVDQPLPAGRRVAVLGNAGGSLGIVGDALHDAGLVVAELSAATHAGLEGLVPHKAGQPRFVDLGLAATEDDFVAATALLVDDPGVDALLMLFAPSLGATADEALAALVAGRAVRPDVPVVACFYGGLPTRDELPVDGDAPVGHAVSVFAAVDAAARALGRVADYAAWRARDEGAPFDLAVAAVDDARAVVGDALVRGATELGLDEMRAVLDAAGVAFVPTLEVMTAETAAQAAEPLGYPVALKAAGRPPLAKTVAAGVAIDIPDAAGLAAAWERMRESLGEAMLPAVVQAMIDPGVDVAVVVSDHPEVGPVISLRPGGAHAALDLSAEVRVLPLGDLEAARLVDESRLAPFLSTPARTHLQDVLLRLAALVEDVPEIVEVTLNPVIVDAHGATVIEAHLAIAEVEHEPVSPIRRV